RHLQRFDLPADRVIKKLSKGMRAKVALALSMSHEPDLLLLDEPTSGLDALVRREFLESMVDWAAAGRTVFIASHQVAEVERVADVVAVLRGGKLTLIERLDVLKATVRAATVAFAGPAPEDGRAVVDGLGEVLAVERRGREARFLVRGLTDEHEAALRRRPGVAEVETESPSLEEMMLMILRDGRSDADDPGPAAPAPEPQPVDATGGTP
ncbi:MAG: AAA family ATPase, partial [Planctomycetia bacterium]